MPAKHPCKRIQIDFRTRVDDVPKHDAPKAGKLRARREGDRAQSRSVDIRTRVRGCRRGRGTYHTITDEVAPRIRRTMQTYEDLDVGIRGNRLGPSIPRAEIPVLNQVSESTSPENGKGRTAGFEKLLTPLFIFSG